MAKTTNRDMAGFIAIAKALSDSNRVRALFALRGGELCVCQIIELLGLAPSTVSKHMSILRHAGLVTSRKDARWMHYRLSEHVDKSVVAQSALGWIFEALEDDEIVNGDRATMRKITRQDRSNLCKVQRSR